MSNNLRKEFFSTLLILFCAYISIGQNRIEKNYQNYIENRSFPSSEIFFVNSLNPSIDELIEFYNNSSRPITKRNIIRLIGFVASQTNDQAISFLNKIISDNPIESTKVEAIHAILMIGGDPMEEMLKNIFSIENYELQFRSLRYCWMLDNLTDLKIIENVFEEILVDQPKWKISQVIKKNFLIKVETSIEILESSNSSKVEKMLMDIIMTGGESYNYTEPGGLSLQWATKMLFLIKDDKTQIYDFYLSQKNKLFELCEDTEKPCYVGKVIENLFFYLDQMGYELNDSEEDWMSKGAYFPFGSMMKLFNSSNSLSNYLEFRSKFPLSKFNHRCH